MDIDKDYENRLAQRFNNLNHQVKVLAPSARCVIVTKNQPPEAVEALYRAGARHFGENYVNEAIPKIQALRHLKKIQWHFIGHIQSRLAKEVATHFHYIDSLDRLKTAIKLNDQAMAFKKKRAVLMEVNISQAPNKYGLVPVVEEIIDFIRACQPLLALHLEGFMIIPEINDVSAFTRMHDLAQSVRKKTGLSLPILSMGMSADYTQALSAGATEIRVGRSIFAV